MGVCVLGGARPALLNIVAVVVVVVVESSVVTIVIGQPILYFLQPYKFEVLSHAVNENRSQLEHLYVGHLFFMGSYGRDEHGGPLSSVGGISGDEALIGVDTSSGGHSGDGGVNSNQSFIS